MQRNCGCHNVGCHPCDDRYEFLLGIGKMLRQYRRVHDRYGVRAGKANGQNAEVSLQSRIDGKAARGGIHAGHILTVMDVLKSQLVAIVPMAIVQMLPHQSVRLDGTIAVHLGHIDVVNKVDQGLVAGRSVVATRFLFQRFLQYLLQHFGRRIEIEWYCGDSVILRKRLKLLIDQYGLTATSIAH